MGESMIDVLQEVTDWAHESVNNGIYHVNGAGHLVAYQPNESASLTVFKNPLKGFSKSRRKFKKLSQYQEEVPSNVKTVQGSNGKVYYIEDGKCTCPGFKFRGNCKHI
jgi:hypothetical protein